MNVERPPVTVVPESIRRTRPPHFFALHSGARTKARQSAAPPDGTPFANQTDMARPPKEAEKEGGRCKPSLDCTRKDGPRQNGEIPSEKWKNPGESSRAGVLLALSRRCSVSITCFAENAGDEGCLLNPCNVVAQLVTSQPVTVTFFSHSDVLGPRRITRK